MEWKEITVTVDSQNVTVAEDIANMTVPYGIYTEDYTDLEQQALEIAHIDLIDEDLINKDRTKAIIHVYISDEDNAYEAVSFLKDQLNLYEQFPTPAALNRYSPRYKFRTAQSY